MKENKASKKNLATTLTDFLADKLASVDAPTAKKINKSLEKFAKKLALKFEKEKGKLVEKADKKAAKLSKKAKKIASKEFKENKITTASKVKKQEKQEAPATITRKARATKETATQPASRARKPLASARPTIATPTKITSTSRVQPAGQPNNTTNQKPTDQEENNSN